MKEKQRILIATYGFFPAQQFGGPPVSIDNFCTHLKECEVFIVTRNHDLLSKTPLKQIQKGWNKRTNCKVQYLADSEYNISNFDRIIKEISPDLVYIQTFFQARTFLGALIAARRNRVPVLLAPRGELCDGAMKKKYKKIPYIYILKALGTFKNMCFQATSDEEYDRIGFYFNKDTKRIFKLPNFPAVPKNISANRANVSRAAGLKLVTVCRIVPQKNILYACKCLKNVSSNIEWTIFGSVEDAAYWSECEQEIRTFPANVVVKYKGPVSHDAVSDILHDYNVFFLPTRSENFGHSIVEGMFAGCIPIISDQTPWNDLEEHDAGFSLPLEKMSGFADSIEYLASCNDETLRQKSYNAQNYIRTKTDVESLTHRYYDAINTTIDVYGRK